MTKKYQSPCVLRVITIQFNYLLYVVQYDTSQYRRSSQTQTLVPSLI